MASVGTPDSYSDNASSACLRTSRSESASSADQSGDRARIVEVAQRFGGRGAHLGLAIAQRGDQRGHGARVLELAECVRGRSPHIRDLVPQAGRSAPAPPRCRATCRRSRALGGGLRIGARGDARGERRGQRRRVRSRRGAFRNICAFVDTFSYELDERAGEPASMLEATALESCAESISSDARATVPVTLGASAIVASTTPAAATTTALRERGAAPRPASSFSTRATSSDRSSAMPATGTPSGDA